MSTETQNRIAVGDVNVAEKPQLRRVPVLRFPEFSGPARHTSHGDVGGEWEERRLGEISKWSSGGTPSMGNPEYWRGDIPWISASVMRGNYFSDANLYVTSLGLKNGSRLARKGSVLLLVRGSMLFKALPVGLAMRDLAFNQDVKSIECNPDLYPRYLVLWFLSKEKFFLHKVTGTGIGAGKLDTEELQLTKIYTPSLPEQQKIAEFLGMVDERIDGLSKKKESLERYKKGVIQKIFCSCHSRAGGNPEHSSCLRFKDENGNSYPDWEEKKLGEIMIESRVKGSAGNLARKLTVKLWGKGVFEKSDKSSGSINTQYYKRNAGQFIYSKLDFLNCAFGIIPLSLDEFESTVDLPAFDIKEGYAPEFILERVKQKNFYKKFGETADGSRKAKRIHADTFLSFTIATPSFSEQKKIAEFLTSLDEKISAISAQLSRAKEFKKGLLQQMFV